MAEKNDDIFDMTDTEYGNRNMVLYQDNARCLTGAFLCYTWRLVCLVMARRGVYNYPKKKWF